MFMHPRIRQIMPAVSGMRELAVNRGHMQPFSADADDDIQVWPIVGFALVEDMGWLPHEHDWTDDDTESCREEKCGEPTVVHDQVVSAMVMMPRYSEIELTVNIFNVDDAEWRRVATLQPDDDLEEGIHAARAALVEEKAERAKRDGRGAAR